MPLMKKGKYKSPSQKGKFKGTGSPFKRSMKEAITIVPIPQR